MDTKSVNKEAPIKNYTELPKSIINSSESTIKPADNSKIMEPPSVIYNIRKDNTYKDFLKLLKQNKGITAIVTAEILGVHRDTIRRWLDTPQARRIISDNISARVNVIESSKDWKAHAYLIDKATGKQDITNVQVNVLDGLTIVRR